MENRTAVVLQQLSGFATGDPLAFVAETVAQIPGTRWLVPIGGDSEPLGRRPIAIPGVAESGLTLADVERPEVVDALNAFGLGVTAAAYIEADGWYAGFESWGPTSQEAQHGFARLLRSLPGPRLLSGLLGRRGGEWPLDARRWADGYRLAAPTAAASSRAMLSWARAHGTAALWADRTGAWPKQLADALAQMRRGAVREVLERHVLLEFDDARATVSVEGVWVELSVARCEGIARTAEKHRPSHFPAGGRPAERKEGAPCL